jgi:hypothetical protein
MDIQPYTVLILHYNQNEILNVNINRMLKFDVPPQEIIVLDDGSDIKPDHTDNRITFLYFPHKGNLALMMNEGHMKVKTDFYIQISAKMLLDKDFIKNSFLLYKNKHRFTGVMIHVKDYNVLPEMILTPPFFQQMRIDNTIIDFHPLTPYLEHKNDWVWYNEAYEGYGYEDVDYYYRSMLSGNTAIRTNMLVFYKFLMPQLSDFYKDRNVNLPLHKKIIEEMHKGKIIKFTEKNRYYNPLIS